MGLIAGRHREIGKRYSDHAGLADKDSDVVEISAVAGQAAGLQFSKRGSGPGNCFILLRDHENGISGCQDGIRRRNEVASALSNHRDSHTPERRRQFVESLSGVPFANRNFTHVEPLRLRRKFRLYDLGHEVNAQDRTDHPEWVGNGIANRRVLVLHHVERCLERGGACHRSRIYTERMSDFDAENVPEPKGNGQTGKASNNRQQIVLLADAKHAFEELPAVEDPDPIQEHDQSCQADWSDDLGFGRERTDGKADEKNGADAERKSPDTDLTDQITQSDREKCRQDRLAADDLASKVQHDVQSPQPVVSAPGTLPRGIARSPDPPAPGRPSEYR